MITDLKPYPRMKDSGVEWLGEVPEHWEVRRNGRLFAQRNETGYPDLPILEVSLRTGVRVRDFASSTRKQVMSERDKYKRAAQGDIAYNMMRMWQGAVGVVPENGLISPAYVVARPLPGSNANYFEKLFRTPAYMQEVDNHSRGIVKDRNRLYWEDFKRIPTCYPPPEEQVITVRYLEHVDRRVQRLVRAKRKLIALLIEQKQAIINRAVTLGLDPDVPLKDSGVEWLGKVPAHWEAKRLKWVTRLQRGFDLPADQRIPGPFPVVSSGGVIDSHVESRVTAPGVVLGRYGSTDSVFFIEQDFWPHNTSLFVTDFQGNFPKWCYYLLKSISKADHAGKSAVPGIDRKDLFQIVVAVPPESEQHIIVNAVEQGSQQLDLAVTKAQREINLLHEYHTRLTADVVTGKLDVRKTASTLSEEIDEPDFLSEQEEKLNEIDAIPDDIESRLTEPEA